jgi:branched-chain amino acid transport system substrate-binding protein
LLLLVAALMLAACGGGGKDPGSGKAPTAKVQVVKIGVVGPMSGSLSRLGVGIRNSVDLAVDQANAAERIPGWKIEVVVEDDTADPNIGAEKATSLAADPAVAAVIGTVNNSVAAKVQPVLSAANVAMVSPASNGVELTRGTTPAAPKRPFGTYFTLATSDRAQGPFAADFATADLNVKSVVTIHDGKVYGRGLVESFTSQLLKNGATVGAAEVVDPAKEDFKALLQRVKPLNPDLIFYGGEFPQAQRLTAEAEAQGVRAKVMGGDGIFDPTYIETAKEAAEGDLSVATAATSELDGTGEFTDAYAAAKYPEAPSTFGAYAYDAANVLIDALAKVLDKKLALPPDVRPAVVAAVQATSLDGATGPIAFDEFGEAKGKFLTVYRVTNQQWTPIKTDEVG